MGRVAAALRRVHSRRGHAACVQDDGQGRQRLEHADGRKAPGVHHAQLLHGVARHPHWCARCVAVARLCARVCCADVMGLTPSPVACRSGALIVGLTCAALVFAQDTVDPGLAGLAMGYSFQVFGVFGFAVFLATWLEVCVVVPVWLRGCAVLGPCPPDCCHNCLSGENEPRRPSARVHRGAIPCWHRGRRA